MIIIFSSMTSADRLRGDHRNPARNRRDARRIAGQGAPRLPAIATGRAAPCGHSGASQRLAEHVEELHVVRSAPLSAHRPTNPQPIHCPRRHDSSRSLLARNRERSSMLLRVEECRPGRYASIKPVVPRAGYFFCKGHFLQGCGFLQHFLLLLMKNSYL